MDIITIDTHISILAIVIAAITNIILGSFWYSPFMFGDSWMKEHGFTEEDFRNGLPMRVIILLSFTSSFIAAFAIDWFIGEQSNVLKGAITGVLIAVCWITTSKANHLLFEHRSFKLFLIHGGYDIFGYMIMGAILGAWK